MTGFLVRRRRGAHELGAREADLARRAASALLAADDRIREAAEEADFAEAELGAEATGRLRAALDTARRVLIDAFRLQRLNGEATPSSTQLTSARNARIIRACDWIEQTLDAETAALAQHVARARGTEMPETPVFMDAEPTKGAEETHQKDAAPGLTYVHLQLRERIEIADRRLEVARDLVATRSGRPGAEASARLALAEHLRADITLCLGGASDASERVATIVVIEPARRERLAAMAERVAELTDEAVELM
ncbi:hypothetical protein ABIQ69_02955 [Agromyces sp. G08B096]|uniref:DUF222 domain-containing protein n=1 Tax=Agromyces sp. G08B096 TaxID=3156399 RepID=A0AAU7W998_9MICO